MQIFLIDLQLTVITVILAALGVSRFSDWLIMASLGLGTFTILVTLWLLAQVAKADRDAMANDPIIQMPVEVVDGLMAGAVCVESQVDHPDAEKIRRALAWARSHGVVELIAERRSVPR